VTLVERFWIKVDTGGICWEWLGGKNPKGYGHLNREINGRNLPIRAHRFSWMIHYGEIPEGMCVCHKCDNPGCVRPEHLFLGTISDNGKDAWRKGRLWINLHNSQAYRCLKDSCKRGHPWPESLRVRRSDGYRECAECVHIRERNRGERDRQCTALARPSVRKIVEGV
jgi:hypothetical protein